MQRFYKKKGSVSIEMIIVLIVISALIAFSHELLQIMRVEQKLTNVTYNITQLTSQHRLLNNIKTVERLSQFEVFIQQELESLIKGKAQLTIEHYNMATLSSDVLVASSCVNKTAWPKLDRGHFLRVTACYQIQDTSDSWFGFLWQKKQLNSQFIEEVK